MKKWMVFILLLITTAEIVIPCCVADDCRADQIASAVNHESKKPEGTCSPFFACATCPGFVELARQIQLVSPVVEKQVYHERIVVFHLANYSSSCWQPPRI